jgi:ABC-type nitrate/sulfonate/bicarbonate transport system permease component
MKKIYYLPSILAMLFFLILWEALVYVFKVEPWILPAPSVILTAIFSRSDLLIYHASQTVMEALVGLSVAIIIGIGIAVFMEWSQFFRKILRPFVLMSQSIPFIALAPLLVVWFGYGILPKVIVIALACFFPITINLYDGFKSVDQNMIKLLKSMNASKWQIFKIVKIPSALPYFFSGLRLSGAYVIGVALVSEWIGAEKGLGIFLIRAAKSYLTDSVFAVIFVVTFLSLLLVFAIDKLTRFIIPWHFHKKEEGVV